MWKTTFDNSLVIFSLVFAFSFAFFVGISTANFGALVRYKIPLIPFLMASLFIIIRKYNREKEDDKKKKKEEKEKIKAMRNTSSQYIPGGFGSPYKF
jgi:large-conductance mechanosensitive channel